MELKNKTIVITGGTRGLGYELAKTLKIEGANVVVCSHNPEHVKTTGEELGVMSIVADVTKESDLENLAKQVVEKFGQIDIWINNAGVWMHRDYVENFNINEAKRLFEINFWGSLFGMRESIKIMKKQKFGTILNIVSSSSLIARPKSSMYSASKWAIRGLSLSVQEEVKEFGINVYAVHPHGIKTEIFQNGITKDEYESNMEPSYVAEKIISNLKQDVPEEELVIKRPAV